MNKLTNIVLVGLVAVPVVITVAILTTGEGIKNVLKKNKKDDSEEVA